jgi:hypothetical protein
LIPNAGKTVREQGELLTAISSFNSDYYHQIHEVWPHTFGAHLFQKIRGHLDRMLLGTKEEWELSYSSAKTFLLHDAKKFSTLEGIYKKSSYFAGWFLKTARTPSLDPIDMNLFNSSNH